MNKAKRYKSLDMRYEAAMPNRNRKVRTCNYSQDPNDELAHDAVKIRNSVRQQLQNDPLAANVIKQKVVNVVGGGINPLPRVKLKNGEDAAQVNSLILNEYKEWAKNPEVTGQKSFNECIRAVCHSAYRDGDAGLVLHAVDDAKVVPFKLELIESDRVPHSLTDQKKRVVQGVRIDQFGKPTGYAIQELDFFQHWTGLDQQYRIIDAENVVFFALRQRINQLRGVSLLAKSLRRFQDLNDFDANERTAASISSALALFITRGATASAEAGFLERMMEAESAPIKDSNGDPVLDANGQPTFEEPDEFMPQFSPGTITELGIGEMIHSFQSDRPNTTLEKYRELVLRAVAGESGVGYSQISGVYAGSFSALKAESNAIHVATTEAQDELISDVLQPVYDRFVLALLTTGKLNAFTASIDPSSLMKASWVAPTLPLIDTAVEGAGYIPLVSAGLISIETVQRKVGLDPVNEQERMRLEESMRQKGEMIERPPAANAKYIPKRDQKEGEDGGQNKLDPLYNQ